VRNHECASRAIPSRNGGGPNQGAETTETSQDVRSSALGEGGVTNGHRVRALHWDREVSQSKAAATRCVITFKRARIMLGILDARRFDERTRPAAMGSRGPKCHDKDPDTVDEPSPVVDTEAWLWPGPNSMPSVEDAICTDITHSGWRGRAIGAEQRCTTEERTKLFGSAST
jgi:hypothetical protein